MKIKADTPCYRFRDASPEEQIAKIKEEVAEIESALAEYKEAPCDEKTFIHLLVEVMDVQVCAATFIYQLVKSHALGSWAAKTLLKKAKRAVVAKNMYRGYYQNPEEVEQMEPSKREMKNE